MGPDEELGYDVALSEDGTVALLGAPRVKTYTGAADVFRASGGAAWVSTSTPTATLTIAGGSAGNFFGLRVALSTDGTTALVTAPGRKAQRGAAFIFRVDDVEAWASSVTPTATLADSGGAPKDILGIGLGVSADGATALVGVPYARFATGAADLFHVSEASSWASSSTPTAILTNSALDACVVPKLKRLTVPAARSALKARKCRLGRVRRVAHAGAKRGRVFSQSRPPGWRLAVNTRVGVKVVR